MDWMGTRRRSLSPSKTWTMQIKNWKKITDAVDSGRQALESDLERTQSELSSVEDLLPGDVRTEYNRISEARGEEALAPVDDNVLWQLLSNTDASNH